MLIFNNIYLAFAIFLSPLGLRKLHSLQKNSSFLQFQLNELTSINLELKQQIENLDSKNVDKEFLDEVLKKYIFYSDSKEKLIITDDDM